MSADLQTLCEAVDGGALMRHVGVFAQWEKLSGSPGEADSLRYIQAQLDALGFRTRLLSHDAYISLPGRSLVAGGQHGAAQHHAFVLARIGGWRARRAGACRCRRRCGFRRTRRAWLHRAGRWHRDTAGLAPRVARRCHRTVAHQSARASARDVRLAGVGQSFRRDDRPNCPRQSFAACCCRMARHCANAWHAASDRP